MAKGYESLYRDKEVLVTGGAGFIGSHLVEALVELGARVTVMDNFSTGSLRNLTSVLPRISFLYADVRSSYSALRATANKQVVFHLAALVSVPESLKWPELCHQVNVQGSKNILEACRLQKVPRIVFASSSAIYGNSQGICDETTQPHPLTPYAQSKWDAEELCTQFSAKFNLNTVNLRYFNVYGPRQNPEGPYAGVVARFSQLLKEGKPLTVYGDGAQTRDFISIKEVTRANLAAGAMAQPGATSINVASGTSISVLQLIEQLEKELGVKRTGVEFLDQRPGDILHSQASCQRLQQLLGAL